MIKIVTTALILIITLPTEIPWKSSNQLKWSDFKREPVKSSEYFAVTNSGIKYSWSSSFDGTSYAFSFEVNSYFNPNESWVKKGKKTDELLNHEQLHFNISELHARSLRSKLNNFEFTDDFKTEIDSIYNLVRKEENDAQELYDNETNHSLNKEEQKRWNKLIKAELKVSELK